MAGLVNSTRIELLSRDNYDTWRMQIEALLIKYDRWMYVSGTLPKPETAADQEAWTQADQKAKSDLILSISPMELHNARGCETSHDLWEKLEAVYASKGPARKTTLLKQLTLQKLSESGNVRDHIMKFFDAVDKLKSMSVTIHKDMLATLLLYSLPSTFENFRCAIESRDELPDPDQLKIKILEEYEARSQKGDGESTTGAFMAKQKKKPFVKKWTESKSEGKQSSNDRFQVRCHICNKLGHKSSRCWHRGNDKKHSDNQANTYFASVFSENFLALQASDKVSSSKWCLDSGCTTHLCKDRTEFTHMNHTEPKNVNLANDTSVSVSQAGVVEFIASVSNDRRQTKLKDVLHVPELHTNLMSVAKITDRGHEVVFKKNIALIKDQEGKTRLVADRQGDLFYIRQGTEHANSVVREQCSDLELWHRRLGHLNYRDVIELSRRGAITEFEAKPMPSKCEICLRGKLTAVPFCKRKESAVQVLEIVHMDICGPMRTESQGKAKYFITFTDEFTRWCEVRFLTSKKDALKAFKEYKNMAEKQTGKHIKNLQSDNGTEFCNHEFDTFLRMEGIKRRLTVPYTPQQNGIAERKNRTLVEMARCMIMESRAPSSFWAEAIAMANHIRNRCPTKSLNGKIPYELWTGRNAKLKYLHSFGIKAYILDKSPNKDKFAPRGKEGMLVGYSDETKGYRVWIPQDRRVTIARDVRFLDKYSNEGESQDIILPAEMEISQNYEAEPNQDILPDPHSPIKIKRTRGRPRKVYTGNRGRPKKMYQYTPVQNQVSQQTEENATEGCLEETVNDEHCEDGGTTTESDNDAFIDAVSSDETVCFSEVTIHEAMASQNAHEWKEAIYSEVKSLVDNGTWDIVRRPVSKNVVTCRTVLTNKRAPDGSIVRRKARVVARGFSQRPGIDFKETFSPVARMSSLRMILSLAARYNLKLHQVDVETAYLNGHLEEEVFMEKPDFLEEMLKLIVSREDKKSMAVKQAQRMLKEMHHGGEVCRLRKALYGLRQAGRQWNATLNKKLLDLGLKATNADSCIYFARRGNAIMLLLVYVDDIIIASDNKDWIQDIIQGLQKNFKIKDLGPAKYCLGIEIDQTEDKVSISQKGYIQDILHRFGMNDCNPVSTPLDVGSRLVKNEQNEDDGERKPYRELVGALMYLATSTRPDIAHSMSVLSQFNDCHNSTHWRAAKRVLRYLSGTSNYCIVYRKTNENLLCYVDADWGSCSIDRRSYTGFSFLLGGGTVSWESRKQRTVALSSTEAEYMAITEAVKEAIHLRTFLHELGFHNIAKTVLFNDNRGAGLLTQNPVFHHRTKHIDMRYHFIRSALKEEDIRLGYLSTNEMAADVLTKALPRQKHNFCVNKLGIIQDVLNRN